jgi:hypothetical protein
MAAHRKSPEKMEMYAPGARSFEAADVDSQIIEFAPVAETRLQYLRRYFTSREGWVGDYVRKPVYLVWQKN